MRTNSTLQHLRLRRRPAIVGLACVFMIVGIFVWRRGHDERFVGRWIAARVGPQPAPFVMEFNDAGDGRVPASGLQGRFKWWVNDDELVMQDCSDNFVRDAWTRMRYAYAKATHSSLPDECTEFPIHAVEMERIAIEIVTRSLREPDPETVVGRQGLVLTRMRE